LSAPLPIFGVDVSPTEPAAVNVNTFSVPGRLSRKKAAFRSSSHQTVATVSAAAIGAAFSTPAAPANQLDGNSDETTSEPVAVDPETAKQEMAASLCRQAAEYFFVGEYAASSAKYRAALAVRPGDANTLYTLAECCFRMDDIENAFDYARQAFDVSAAAQLPHINNLLSRIYLQMGDLESAASVAYADASAAATGNKIKAAHATLKQIVRERDAGACLVPTRMLDELSESAPEITKTFDYLCVLYANNTNNADTSGHQTLCDNWSTFTPVALGGTRVGSLLNRICTTSLVELLNTLVGAAWKRDRLADIHILCQLVPSQFSHTCPAAGKLLDICAQALQFERRFAEARALVQAHRGDAAVDVYDSLLKVST
jgi:tetratricopeptide (TPR) repeat protein